MAQHLEAVRVATSSNIDQLTRLHRPRGSSNCTPYERFLTASHIHEPFPLHAKQALSDSGIGLSLGYQESVGLRSGAASALARENPTTDMESVFQLEVTSRRAKTVPLDGRAWVVKEKKKATTRGKHHENEERQANDPMEMLMAGKRRVETWPVVYS